MRADSLQQTSLIISPGFKWGPPSRLLTPNLSRCLHAQPLPGTEAAQRCVSSPAPSSDPTQAALGFQADVPLGAQEPAPHPGRPEPGHGVFLRARGCLTVLTPGPCVPARPHPCYDAAWPMLCLWGLRLLRPPKPGELSGTSRGPARESVWDSLEPSSKLPSPVPCFQGHRQALRGNGPQHCGEAPGHGAGVPRGQRGRED